VVNLLNGCGTGSIQRMTAKWSYLFIYLFI